MTVGEHLKFYARLKGTAPHRLELEIDMYVGFKICIEAKQEAQ